MNIFATRFNNETFKEYNTWREKNEYKECIYNSPVKITEKLFPNEQIFVLEMNNSENKIVGIGKIKNKLVFDNKYRIYSDNNYNRYTYKGQYRIERKELTKEEEKIIHILDVLLFSGARHMKRGQGIQALSTWITNNRHIDFTYFLNTLFQSRFREDLSNRPLQN